MAVGQRLRFEILKRDGFRCAYCGATAKATQLHVDHIVPVSKGGSDDPSNLITSCERCNLGKSNVELHEAHPTVAVPYAEAVARTEAAAQLADAQAAKARAIDALVDRARELWASHVGGRVPRAVDGALRRLVVGENADDLEPAMQAVARKRGLNWQDKARYFFGVLRRMREDRHAQNLSEAERAEKRAQLSELGRAAFEDRAYEEAATHLLAARNLGYGEADAFMEGRACLAAGWFDRALRIFQQLAEAGYSEWASLFNAMLAAERLGADDLALDLASRVVAGASDPDLVEKAHEHRDDLLRARAETEARERRALQAKEARQREWEEQQRRRRKMESEGRTFKSDMLTVVMLELEGRAECTIPELKRSDRVVACARAWAGKPESYIRSSLVSLGWRKGELTESHPRARLWLPPEEE